MSDPAGWTIRLQEDGLLERGPDGYLRTTQRWHSALARAALRLHQRGSELTDMRTPIAAAMVDFYEHEPAPSLADGIREMLIVAMSELVAIAPPPSR